MYRVELDGVTLYDPRLKDYDIFTPKLKLEVNKAGAFDFRIYPSHPLYNRIFKLKSIVEVYQDDTLLFRGRVLDDEMDFNKSKMVICEGELAYFNDSVLRPYNFTGSVSNYLKLIVDQHNSQVQSSRRFTLGNVTVTDPNNLIVRADSTYPKTWDVVQSKLIKLLGGYLMVRRENGVNYLDYLKDSNKISLQKIELGKNLLDLVTQSSASDVYTAILPLGAEINEDTGERLTIKSVNAGKDFIQDDDAVAKYGFIMQVGDWKDVTIASNLLMKARQELAQLIKLSLTLELTAIDLSMIDVDIDDFKVFEYVDVLSTPHGIDERLLVEKMEINLTSPDSNKITIGQQKKSLTDTQIETDKAIGNIQIIKGPPGKDGEKGDKGDPGNDGIAGKDGVGVRTTIIEYALSTSGTVSPSSGWSVNVPSLVKGQYLWTRTKWTYTDDSTETGYSVTYISKDGNDGSDGIAGKDGVGIKSTAISYVGSINGTTKPTTGWTSTIPSVPEGQYLWTRTTWTYTDNTTETGYSVAKMGVKGDKGDPGERGNDGIAGKDGVGVLSTTIEYALSTSGTTNPSSGWTVNVPSLIKGQYLWTRTKWVYTDGTSETGYSVTYISKDGNNGSDGIAGKDGVGIKTTVIEYASSTSGVTKPSTGWTAAIPNVAEGNYLWTRTTWTYTDNTTETGYSVAKMGAKGDKGDKGIQGPAGANGTSQYVHIRYSANADGSAMTTTPQTTTAYIGLANTTSATAPATNASYTWTKTKGEQGNQGIQGPSGTNGQTTYTWVKYADTATGTGMSDSPDGKLYIGLAFNKTTQTESTSYSAYQWSLMPQNIEIGGRNLLTGTDETTEYSSTASTRREFFKTEYDFAPIFDKHGLIEYTLSFELKSEVAGSINVYMQNGSGARYSFTKGLNATTDWKEHVVTFTPSLADETISESYLAFYGVYDTGRIPTVRKLKLEKGNIATDWTPAPEDIEAELNEKADNEYVTEVVTTLNTTIEETAGLIRTEVAETYTEKGEFTTYQETVSTEFQQTKEAFDFTFNDLITQIETLDGETQAQFMEIVKYIRFVDGNIILGQVGNELELKIQLDRIQFLQSGVEVAYFSNNKLYVTDGEFINSLKLGNFAFMPRENGSLDFKKVVN